MVQILLRPNRRSAILFLAIGLGLGLIPLVIAFRQASGCRPIRKASLQAALPKTLDSQKLAGGRIVGVNYSSNQEREDIASVRVAFRQIEADLRRSRSPENLHKLALVKLAVGNFRETILLLRETVLASPRNARAYNDLAVAYFAYGNATANPRHLILALTNINKALSLNRNLVEPRFNRALILENLFLTNASISAWRAYIQLDSSSQWTQIARHHLFSLLSSSAFSRIWEAKQRELHDAALKGEYGKVESIVSSFGQPSIIYTLELFSLLARAEAEGNFAEAAQMQKIIECISQQVLRLTNDSFLHDSWLTIESARGRNREDLLRGHLEYGEAIVLYNARRIQEAKRAFSRVQVIFQKQNSPFSVLSSYNIAACSYFAQNYLDAERAGLDILPRARRLSYYSLVGKTAWLIGLVHLSKAEPATAVPFFSEALHSFSKTRELGNLSSIFSLMASCFNYMGDKSEEWRLRYQALKAAVKAQDKGRLPVIFSAAARSLLGEAKPKIALLFLNEVLALDLASSDALAISEALWWRALIRARTGDYRQARYDIAAAKTICSRIGEEGIRNQTLAGILAAEGSIERPHDPYKAREALSKSFDMYQKSGYGYPLVDIYLERALSSLALSDINNAEKDLAAGISEYSVQQEGINTPNLQISFFDRAQEMIDVMILLQERDRRDPRRAFEYADKGKSRLLLRMLTTRSEHVVEGGGSCIELAEAGCFKRLPKNTGIIAYAVLSDQLYIWFLDSSGIRFRKVDVSRIDLARLISLFRSHLINGVEDPSLDLKLARLLLVDLVKFIRPYKQLVIVPDKELNMFPFSALRYPGTDRFLAEKHYLSISPSVSVFLSLNQRKLPNLFRKGRMTALAVANPALDRRAYPDLPELPGSEREGSDIANLLPGSIVLRGGEATVPRFLSELNNHDIIHFSGHVLPNTQSPYYSRLLFSPIGGRRGSGDLYARDIFALTLTRPALAVLSACGTGLGEISKQEGITDLAKPFLGAGIPTVLVSLWKVNDETAESFLRLFYRKLRECGGVAEAVQYAQGVLIHNAETGAVKRRDWAAFEMVGSFQAR